MLTIKKGFKNHISANIKSKKIVSMNVIKENVHNRKMDKYMIRNESYNPMHVLIYKDNINNIYHL
jgi:hypothetical protein